MAQEFVNLDRDEKAQLQYHQASRRSRLETFCDIIRVIGQGVEKPTHVMYKANLSWKVMQQYMKSLEAQGMVVVSVSDQGNKTLYHLTDKGFQLLKQFLSIREDLNLASET